MPMPAIDPDSNMPDSNLPMDVDLASKVEAQARQLSEQEKRIQDLERCLLFMGDSPPKEAEKGEVVLVEENPGSPESPDTNNRKTRIPVDSATYEFDHSMWDAALLVFVNYSNFADMIILLSGCLLNFGLQIALLLTIAFDMLENKYTDDKVGEMLQWRVEKGHVASNFDAGQGHTLLSKLCSRNEWTFEQDEYDLMYDYLYKPIPGFVLSILAIIIWVLTIMREYRRCIEQALAVIHLPAARRGKELEENAEDDTMVIVGLHPAKKAIVLICLSLFRLGVMFVLGVIGCAFLAQTDGLNDLILNAVALAFVMDVDELVADVLLTERLRSTLGKLEPLSCGKILKREVKCIPFKDFVRYAITAGLITFSIVYWLHPFYWSINSAALALCGGYQDFTYSGGQSSSASTIIFSPTSFEGDSYVTSCEMETDEAYKKKYYSAKLGNQNQTTASKDYNVYRRKEVLDFAFSQQMTNCGPGKILQVGTENAPARTCIDIPDILKRQLKDATAGSQKTTPNCTRFSPSMGCDAAAISLGEITTNEQSCVWSWLSRACDGEPDSSYIYQGACATAGADFDLFHVCDTWEVVFNTPNTDYNCRAIQYCNSPWTCLSMKVKVTIDMNNTDAWANFYVGSENTLDAVVENSFIEMFNAKITETDETLNPYKIDTNGNDYIYSYLESATTQKVTYWIGVPSIAYQIRPKIMISRQDFLTQFNTKIDQASRNIQNSFFGIPMSADSVDFTNYSWSTAQDMRLDDMFSTTTTTPAPPGGYGGDDGGDDGGGGDDGPGGDGDGPGPGP